MPQQHTQITNLDGMRRLVADLRATTPREPSADEIEDARRQQYEPPYAARWRRHQFSDESGRPTRSASSPVEVRAWAGAATAAPAHGASHTEMLPAPIPSDDGEDHPVTDPYPTPSPAYVKALAILSRTIRTARTA